MYVFEVKEKISIETIAFSYYFSLWWGTAFQNLHDMLRCTLLVILFDLIERDIFTFTFCLLIF